MRRLLNIVMMVMAVGVATACGSSRKLGCDVLFRSEATDTIPYRIPALAVLDGNKLLALAD